MTKQHPHKHRGRIRYQDVLVWTLVLAIVVALVYPHWEAFLVFAEANLKLLPMDVTMIPVGAGLFFLFWKSMDRWLFAPCLSLIEQREAATSGALSSAADTNKRADLLEEEFRQKMTETRIEAAQKKIAAIAATKRKAAEIVGRAQAEAKTSLEHARSESARECDSLRQALLLEVDSLVEGVVDKAKNPPHSGQAVH